MVGPAEMMQAGGVGMWGVLVLGLIALVNAVLFARRPERRRVGVVACMGLATLTASLLATCTGLATMGFAASDMAREGGNVTPVLIAGIAECLAPLVLGFSLLTVTAVVSAVGMRRSAVLEELEVRGGAAPAVTR